MKHAKPFELAFEMAVMAIERHLYGQQPHGKHSIEASPNGGASVISKEN
jgi:hypothetical protein